MLNQVDYMDCTRGRFSCATKEKSPIVAFYALSTCFFNSFTTGGMNTNWIMMPAIPVTMAPCMNKTGPGPLNPKKVANTNTTTPATILPPTIAAINDIYEFIFSFSEKVPDTNPYVPNSNIIIGNMGKNTGIPVNTLLIIGVTNPTNKPAIGPKNSPAINTGICIGKNPGPPILN